jgi:ATP-dependent Clp protease ATP-binding subunit ClpC
VRRKPYSVVLLDEIEKAHPDVSNILLQVFEDGVLTDSLKRKVSFKNTVIILTSNIGARQIRGKGKLGFSRPDTEIAYGTMKDMVLDEVKKVFNPEFLNRVDEIIVFRPLNREHIEKIVELLLDQVRERLAEQQMSMTVTPGAIGLLIDKGFDPDLGARPLRRAIQKMIEDPLAELVLRGKVKSGSEIRISKKGTEITIEERTPEVSHKE